MFLLPAIEVTKPVPTWAAYVLRNLRVAIDHRDVLSLWPFLRWALSTRTGKNLRRGNLPLATIQERGASFSYLLAPSSVAVELTYESGTIVLRCFGQMLHEFFDLL